MAVKNGNILDESPVSLAIFAKEIGCSYRKVLMLARTGRTSIDGRTAKLQAAVTESGLVTSRQAHRRFLCDLNGFSHNGQQSAKLAG